MAIELTTATTQQLSGIKQAIGIPFQYPNILPEATWIISNYGNNDPQLRTKGSILDFKGCQKFTNIGGPQGGGWGASITTILNAQDLINLEDSGTLVSLNLEAATLTNTLINQLFTDLPATTKTATINVRLNDGAATCNTSIATNKGYTVVTS